MKRFEREQRRQPEKAVPEPAQRPSGGLQRLQQTAGNRAVSGLIQRQRAGRYRLLDEGLTLDPELEEMMRRLGKPKPDLFDPKALEGALEGRDKPEWTPLPEHVRPEPEPIVPRGKGPETPRKGSLGDLGEAVRKIPMVERGLDKVAEEAKRRWRKARGK